MRVKIPLAWRGSTSASALKGIEVSLSALGGIKYKHLLSLLP